MLKLLLAAFTTLVIATSYGQSLEENQNKLATKASLCEARYRADGFNSTLAFMVGCLNPAFEEFYNSMSAPEYMYDSVKAQSLLMGVKVDANEVDFDTALKNIAAVASVTFNSLQGHPSSKKEVTEVKVDRAKIISECTRTAVVARDSIKTQYDNQWLAFVQSNPMPTGVSSSQQAMMVLNGQLNTAGVVGMGAQNQEQQRLWMQRMSQSQGLHNKQKENAMASTYNSTFELCKIQNGIN